MDVLMISLLMVFALVIVLMVIAPNFFYVITRTPYYEFRFYRDGNFVKRKYKKQATTDLTFNVIGVGTFAYPRTKEEYLQRGICKEVYYDVISSTPMVDKRNPPKITLEDLFEETEIPKDRKKKIETEKIIYAKCFTNFMNPKTLLEIQKANSIKKVITQPAGSFESMKGIIILAIVLVGGVLLAWVFLGGGH